MATKKAQGRKMEAGPRKTVVPLMEGIERVDATSISPFHRWLVYAEPGTYKTTLAATSPNPLILDADKGTDSIVSQGLTANRKRVSDWQDMDDVLDYLRSGGYQNHEWVWLDSVTLFQEKGLHSIMVDLSATKQHRLVWAADKGEYGQNMTRLMDWIRDVTELPINFGITAHAMRYTSPTTEEELLMPAIQGKNMPDKVSGYMSLVGLITRRDLDDGKSEVAIHTRKTASYYAKDHWYAIGTMINPTVPKMLAKINAKIALAKGATPAARPVKSTAKKIAKKG